MDPLSVHLAIVEPLELLIICVRLLAIPVQVVPSTTPAIAVITQNVCQTTVAPTILACLPALSLQTEPSQMVVTASWALNALQALAILTPVSHLA